MATTTPNYGLTKPAATDFYDVSVQNGNMDKIDAALASGLVSQSYTASNDEQIDQVLKTVLTAMGGLTKRTFTLYLDSSANTLGGGTWFVTANKVSNDYATFSAESYMGGSVVDRYSKTVYGGTYNAWAPDDPAAFAPAGYGLGGKGGWVGDINNLTDTGVYTFYDAPGTPMPGYSCMLEVASTAGVTTQTVTIAGYYRDTKVQRSMVSAVGETSYGEWEWVNPPMALGVEYRTTERWNGKAVYRKALALGALPNTSRGHYRWYIDKNATIIRATMHAEKRASEGATTNGDEQYNGDVFFDLANNSVMACAAPWTNGNDWYMDIRSSKDLTYLVNTWGEMAYVKG